MTDRRRSHSWSRVVIPLAVTGLSAPPLLGGVAYVGGTAHYRHVLTSGGSTINNSDSGIPSEANLKNVGFTLNSTQSLPSSGSTVGKARIGFIANSTTASIAFKPGSGIAQSDPSAVSSFSETRIDLQDATRLTWTATSPGFGPPSTRYISLTIGGTIGAGGFARARVNLGWYRNSISGANLLNSVTLDSGTLTTAGVFSQTLSASAPLSGSTLTTGTNILMIGTIQFWADNHGGPSDIIPLDSAFGYSNSGRVVTYVRPPGSPADWFAPDTWQTNNVFQTPLEPGDRAYFPNDQGAPRQVLLSQPISLGVLESNGSSQTTIEGPGQITLQNLGGFTSMVWQRNINGEAALQLGVPLVAGSPTTEFLNDSLNPIFLNGGFSTAGQANPSVIKTGQGPLVINGPQNHPTGFSLNVADGSAQLLADLNGGAMLPRVTVNVAPGAALNLGAPQRLERLDVTAGGLVLSEIPGKQASAVRNLTVEVGGALTQVDLGDDGLVIKPDPGTPDPLPLVINLIQSGFAGGSWNGSGIMSSLAQNPASRTAVGYARANDLQAGTFSFLGQPAGGDDAVMRFTLLGDANLNGAVNIADFARLASKFNSPGTWSDGDFNFDFQVTIADFSLMASNFGLTLPAPGARVPEPAAAVLGATLILAAKRRRR